MNKYMLLLATCIATQAVRADVDVTIKNDVSGEETVVHLAPEEMGVWTVGKTEVCLKNVTETGEAVDLVIVAQQDEAKKDAVEVTEETRTVEMEIKEETVAYGEKVAVLDVTISVEQTEAQAEQN